MDFQKVADAVENSSPEVKELLFSEEIGNFLQTLAQKNNLDEETTLRLVDEIGYIILGLKERSSLKSSLDSMKIPTPQTFSIIQEVNREIFAKLGKLEENPIKTAPQEPEAVVIKDKESKEDAMKRLADRMKGVRGVPEEPPHNLPMVEPGEVAHTVPHVEEKPQASMPNVQSTPNDPIKSEFGKPQVPPSTTRYEDGKDPYREPLV